MRKAAAVAAPADIPTEVLIHAEMAVERTLTMAMTGVTVGVAAQVVLEQNIITAVAALMGFKILLRI